MLFLFIFNKFLFTFLNYMIIIKLQGGKGGGEMIGKRLKKIRENRKISQEEIANVLGIKKLLILSMKVEK